MGVGSTTVMKPSRAYDHVYDNDYIMSSEKDHARISNKASYDANAITVRVTLSYLDAIITI